MITGHKPVRRSVLAAALVSVSESSLPVDRKEKSETVPANGYAYVRQESSLPVRTTIVTATFGNVVVTIGPCQLNTRDCQKKLAQTVICCTGMPYTPLRQTGQQLLFS